MTNTDGNLQLLAPCMFPGGSVETHSLETWRQISDLPNNEYVYKQNATWPRIHWTITDETSLGNTAWKSSEESVFNSENVWNEDQWCEDLSSRKSPISSRPRRLKKSKISSCTTKHVPHRDKPPQIVARRNARERRRVQAVNIAFSRLRKVVPIDNNRGKRVSKVKTLHKAIEYISHLQHLLMSPDTHNSMITNTKDINKENTGQPNTRWMRSSHFQEVGDSQSDSLSDLLEDFEEDL